MYVHVPACLCVYHVTTGALKGQKEDSGPLGARVVGVGVDPGPLQEQ